MLQRGKLLSTDYECLNKLGQGGQSAVWLVRSMDSGQIFAAKQYSKDSAKQIGDVTALREQAGKKEAEILRSLNHPAIPRYIEELEMQGECYLIMEYLEGENLREKLEREGRQPEQKVLDWAFQICNVFLYLHGKNIIYRDLKPGNLLLSDDGQIHLVDFGCARIYSGEKKEDTIYLGTRGYAAPELYGNLGQSDPRTDIYGFGMTLFHLLSGISPADLKFGELPETDGVTGQFHRFLISCVALREEDRWQSFGEVQKELETYQKNRKLQGSLRQKKILKQRHRTGIAGGALIGLGLGFLLFGLSSSKTEQPERAKREEAQSLADTETADVADIWAQLTEEFSGKETERWEIPADPARIRQILSFLLLHTEELLAMGEAVQVDAMTAEIDRVITELEVNPDSDRLWLQTIRQAYRQERAILIFYQKQIQRKGDAYLSIYPMRADSGFHGSDPVDHSEEKAENAEQTEGEDTGNMESGE